MKKLLFVTALTTLLYSSQILSMERQKNEDKNNAGPLGSITDILNHNFEQYLSKADFNSLRCTCKHLHNHIFAGYQLHDSIARGKLSDVIILLTAGANVNEVNDKKETAIKVLLYSGHHSNKKDMARLLAILDVLIKAGLDVNKKDTSHMARHRPVHMAIACDNIPVLQDLIHAKANLTLTNSQHTPLEFACLTNNREAVECLIANGATVNITNCDNENSTPLHVAAEQGHQDILSILIKSGAPLNVANELGFTPLELCALYNKKAAILELLVAGARIGNSLSIAITRRNFILGGMIPIERVARRQALAIYMANYGHNRTHQSPAQHITLEDARLILSYLRKIYVIEEFID